MGQAQVIIRQPPVHLDESGLGLHEPQVIDEVIRRARCQWDGAVLQFACFAHGPYDSPEPEWVSRCPICGWEIIW